jgi:DNA invertase Pin-like site-specific DNA recombinase
MKCISYLRVSTVRQGTSGLGLEAQRAAVAGFLNGGDRKLLHEVVEVESGKRNDRPALAEALNLCRKHRATLVIAKLDRLARNVAFISNLMESGVEFIACDMPTANRLTIHILAAVAEHEREMISQRTKDALAAARARGKQLGGLRVSREVWKDTQAQGNAAKARAVQKKAADLQPVIDQIRAEGAVSLRQIAEGLNARSVPAPKGGQWQATQVQRAIQAAYWHKSNEEWRRARGRS